ncbi:hypothetical protein HPP92_007172 [Vanilla planifolia]|uniref:Uncharacterized protein n=1 Tax=Vanilla planifolia TaxID=51239 RepID=A0A835RGJ9_VANPL|nr:hypothetical protein HPP92_007405 [Vanilla planifolia]KAG0490309.1 hypothetical protein HPP92_007172 [Vanilla planifolia]
MHLLMGAIWIWVRGSSRLGPSACTPARTGGVPCDSSTCIEDPQEVFLNLSKTEKFGDHTNGDSIYVTQDSLAREGYGPWMIAQPRKRRLEGNIRRREAPKNYGPNNNRNAQRLHRGENSHALQHTQLGWIWRFHVAPSARFLGRWMHDAHLRSAWLPSAAGRLLDLYAAGVPSVESRPGPVMATADAAKASLPAHAFAKGMTLSWRRVFGAPFARAVCDNFI